MGAEGFRGGGVGAAPPDCGACVCLFGHLATKPTYEITQHPPPLLSRKSTSSISKVSVEFAGILPIDFLPYPYSGLMVTVAFSPFFIVATATSHPFMTSPLPSLNSKEPVTESLVVSKTLPFSSFALLRRRHELPETEAQPLLDAMRRDGVRMQNTFKNVGKAGYAFNALQRLLLPASLRAPKDTTVSGLEA